MAGSSGDEGPTTIAQSDEEEDREDESGIGGGQEGNIFVTRRFVSCAGSTKSIYSVLYHGCTLIKRKSENPPPVDHNPRPAQEAAGTLHLCPGEAQLPLPRTISSRHLGFIFNQQLPHQDPL